MPASSPPPGAAAGTAGPSKDVGGVQQHAQTGLQQRRRPSANANAASSSLPSGSSAAAANAANAGPGPGPQAQPPLPADARQVMPGGGEELVQDPFLEWLSTAAQSPDLLIPSRLALAALLLLPLLVWCLAVALGMLAFEGLPTDKRGVWHALMWFDKGLFRTLAGPALPFLVLLLRLASTSRLPHHPPQSRAQPPASSSSSSSHKGPAGGALPAATWPLGAPVAYACVTFVRMLLYAGHLEVQRLLLVEARRAAARDPGAATALLAAPRQVLSDHVLLGASVMACLQVELLCGVSDAVKLAATRGASELRLLAASGGVVLGAALMALVSADMHFTARIFHHPHETLAALLAGLLLFQIPLLAGAWKSCTMHPPRPG